MTTDDPKNPYDGLRDEFEIGAERIWNQCDAAWRPIVEALRAENKVLTVERDAARNDRDALQRKYDNDQRGWIEGQHQIGRDHEQAIQQRDAAREWRTKVGEALAWLQGEGVFRRVLVVERDHLQTRWGGSWEGSRTPHDGSPEGIIRALVEAYESAKAIVSVGSPPFEQTNPENRPVYATVRSEMPEVKITEAEGQVLDEYARKRYGDTYEIRVQRIENGEEKWALWSAGWHSREAAQAFAEKQRDGWFELQTWRVFRKGEVPP